LVQTGISCSPNQLLTLFLDGLPFCEFYPLHAIGSNRYQLLSQADVVSLPGWAAPLRVPSSSRYWFKQVSAALPSRCCRSSWIGCPSASSILFTLLVQIGISCFPNQLLSLFLDGLPLCEFHPLHAIGSNRYQLLSQEDVVALPG
jgi:hypothetical protein